MARIVILGTCSGTEPMPGMLHTSFVLETDAGCYFFDAGESCGRTAHLMGIDLLKLRAVFVSHPHIDHVGGLANLLFCVWKLRIVLDRRPVFGGFPVYIPDLAVWNGALTVSGTTGRGYDDYSVQGLLPREGVVYSDESITVTAVGNHHMPPSAEGLPQSYSYIVEVDGKRIVFSGDLGGISDLEPLLQQETDCLLMETGHHKVADVLAYVGSKPVKKLVFTHHGREIINHREEARKKIADSGLCAFIASDGDVLDL